MNEKQWMVDRKTSLLLLLLFFSLFTEYGQLVCRLQIDAIVNYIKENDLTQEMAAKEMGVQSSRIANVCRGKFACFSIDAMVAMAARAGL